MTDQEKINWVYSQLEDEESKFIFEKRRKYNESGDYSLIWDIIDRYVPEFAHHKWKPGIVADWTRSLKEQGNKTVIFGAGHGGKLLLEYFGSGGVEFLCDNVPDKWGKKMRGIPVISPDELFSMEALDQYIIIISPLTASYRDEIYDMLTARGISASKIYKLSDYLFEAVLEKKQYLDPVVTFGPDEVFVDGGCCDFTNSMFFLDRINSTPGAGCKRIYAFEPDRANVKKCEEIIRTQNLDFVELMSTGLWSSDTRLFFATMGNASSRLVQYTTLDADGGTLSPDDVVEEVKVSALDQCVSEKVTFIKLDVEGAELEALKGAQKILLKDRPKLAICVYHKKEDIYEIPYFIKTLVPQYKLYMRHYSNSLNETVLYAICEGV